jgi:hypothetical protein
MVVRLMILGAWILSLASLRLAGERMFSVPYRGHPEMDLAIGMGFVATALALIASKLSQAPTLRIMAGLALLLSTLAEWSAFNGVFFSDLDYPWMFVAPFFALVCIGGWFCHQRTVSILAVLGTGYWLYGAVLPPKSVLPIVAESKGFRATLSSGGGRRSSWWRMGDTPAWKLEVVPPAGSDFDRLVDVENVEAKGSIGREIAIERIHADVPGNFMWGNSNAPRNVLYLYSWVPSWTRSWDLVVKVPLWPKPTISIVVPVPPAGTRDSEPAHSAKADGYALSVSNVRWEQVGHGDLPEPSIMLTVAYSGYSFGGFNSREFRVTDETGNLLSWGCGSSVGNAGGATEEVEVWPVPKGIKELRVDLFSEESRDAATLVFRFPSLPGKPR